MTLNFQYRRRRFPHISGVRLEFSLSSRRLVRSGFSSRTGFPGLPQNLMGTGHNLRVVICAWFRSIGGMCLSDCRGKKMCSSFVDSFCGLRAAYQHTIMHFGRSGRTVTRFPHKHIMGYRVHTYPCGGIALSAPRSNVPVGREPNVTLIVDIQGSGQVAPRTCWGPHGKRPEICCYSESRPRRSTLGAKAIALRQLPLRNYKIAKPEERQK